MQGGPALAVVSMPSVSAGRQDEPLGAMGAAQCSCESERPPAVEVVLKSISDSTAVASRLYVALNLLVSSSSRPFLSPCGCKTKVKMPLLWSKTCFRSARLRVGLTGPTAA